MAARTKVQPLRTGGHLWGPSRVQAGVTLNALAAESGISKGVLSLMENGRMFPVGDEYARITRALARLTPTEGELAELHGK